MTTDRGQPNPRPGPAPAPEPVPVPPPRRYDPESAPPSPPSDVAYGMEYLILGAVLIILVVAFSARARKLLALLYNPFVIALLLIVFAEYIVLKARDRTYVLEREIEMQRRKRRELEDSLDECREVLRELAPGEPGPGGSVPADFRPGEKAMSRARRLRERLESIR